VKGRSLSLLLSLDTIFRVNPRKLQLLKVSLKHFYSNQRIFKTDNVMRLRTTSRRRTKSHHVARLLKFDEFQFSCIGAQLQIVPHHLHMIMSSS